MDPATINMSIQLALTLAQLGKQAYDDWQAGKMTKEEFMSLWASMAPGFHAHSLALQALAASMAPKA